MANLRCAFTLSLEKKVERQRPAGCPEPGRGAAHSRGYRTAGQRLSSTQDCMAAWRHAILYMFFPRFSTVSWPNTARNSWIMLQEIGEVTRKREAQPCEEGGKGRPLTEFPSATIVRARKATATLFGSIELRSSGPVQDQSVTRGSACTSKARPNRGPTTTRSIVEDAMATIPRIRLAFKFDLPYGQRLAAGALAARPITRTLPLCNAHTRARWR